MFLIAAREIFMLSLSDSPCQFAICSSARCKKKLLTFRPLQMPNAGQNKRSLARAAPSIPIARVAGGSNGSCWQANFWALPPSILNNPPTKNPTDPLEAPLHCRELTPQLKKPVVQICQHSMKRATRSQPQRLGDDLVIGRFRIPSPTLRGTAADTLSTHL